MKRTSQTDKTALFETMPVPKAVLTLAVPTVASILVTLLYSLADTWFVGLLNDPIQNAAVTLIAPVLLAFNAVNNLFGTGCSSMMSRALGRKDTETAQRCASFGFWCSLLCGLLWQTAGEMTSMLAGAGLVFAIRCLSAHYRWNLPKTHD